MRSRQAALDGRPNGIHMEVVCIIGQRVYHAPGSECHRQLAAEGHVMTLSEGQAQEVGMEPCGFCITTDSESSQVR